MRYIWCLLALLGCSAPQPTLTVSAAASLKESITELLGQYKGAKLNLQFASSGELEKQIQGGAAVDLFLSASPEQIDRLIASKHLDASTKTNFASNRLILITYKDSNISGELATVLSNPEVKHIAIGDPALVPAGTYAKKALTAQNLWESISSRTVNGSNVRQVLDLVGRKEAELGFVYQTDLGNRTDVVKLAEINVEPKILYSAAVVVGSEHPKEAKELLDLISGTDGQKTLAKFGFLPP